MSLATALLHSAEAILAPHLHHQKVIPRGARACPLALLAGGRDVAGDVAGVFVISHRLLIPK